MSTLTSLLDLCDPGIAPDAAGGPPEPPAAAGFVLWYRRTRRCKWEPVAAAATASGANVLIGVGGRPGGQWLTRPVGDPPTPRKGDDGAPGGEKPDT